MLGAIPGTAIAWMRFEYNKKDRLLTVFADGEIDQYTADKLRKSIDMELDRHNDLAEMLIDMKKVRFMDSTGIGLILGRYKILRKKGAALSIRNAGSAVDRLLRISGIYSIANER